MEHKSLGRMSAMKWCEENTYTVDIPTPGVFFVVYLYLLFRASLITTAYSPMAGMSVLCAIDGVLMGVAMGGALGPCVCVTGEG